MGLISHKARVREYLADRDFEELALWAGSIRSPQRVLFSLAHDSDELIVWRAIEALGRLMGAIAEDDVERVRDTVRRLMWLMNDESGGLGWRSPELIGEILVNVPELIEEYGRLLPAYFHEEPFEQGSHLAVARSAAINSAPFADFVEDLNNSLEDSDSAIRCHAASALHDIDPGNHKSRLEKLSRDSSPVELYNFENGQLEKTTVARVVEKVLNGSSSGILR